VVRLSKMFAAAAGDGARGGLFGALFFFPSPSDGLIPPHSPYSRHAILATQRTLWLRQGPRAGKGGRFVGAVDPLMCAQRPPSRGQR
jgi:hypothetical protein